MAVPKRKTTPSKRNKRWHGRLAAKNRKVNPTNFDTDSTTGELKLRHHISKSFYYKGKKVFEKKAVK